jgi:hypothetical protein
MDHPVSDMFEPDEETMVLEIVRGFFAIPPEEMMKIGELTKNLLFNPVEGSEEEAMGKLKEVLLEMPCEHVLLAGMFVSGLLRCNLAQQIEQQYARAKDEGDVEPSCGALRE